jgi:hypothetical protein
MTSYADFFEGAATVAGALVGLLFVALSVSPERLRRDTAWLEHQAIASTAFTALIDALFISLIGLEPGRNGLGAGALIMGLLGLSSSGGLAIRLWRARNVTHEGGPAPSHRWPVLLGLIMVVYLVQVVTSFGNRSLVDREGLSATFVYIMFAVGIARSWELLGLNGGGLLDLLAHSVTHPHAGAGAGADAGAQSASPQSAGQSSTPPPAGEN